MNGEEPRGFFPGQPHIEAYGGGGFRFADMSHRGSILFLPSGVRAWSVRQPAEFDEAAFAPVFEEADAIRFLLVGTGLMPAHFAEPLRWAFRARSITVETMLTGAAVRTYNILLSEKRPVAAALIAVD
jgi:uncharacterized protein